jgi:RHS repeat-associated protein
VTGYSWTQGGQALIRSYDQNYALTDITSNALNLHFQRDTLGRVGAEGTAPGANPLSESYRYDPLNRLSELDDHNGVAEQSFTYSPTGDRLTKTVAGQATLNYGYQTGSHRLTAVGSTSRQPDANGNTTAMIDPLGNLIGLDYDDRNLLTTVTSGSNTIGSYQYNGQGVRVWRTITYPVIGQVATVYDPTGTGNLYGEYFAADYREYVYLDGIPVASATDAGRQAPSMTYLYADQLGTVRAATTTAGTTSYQWPWLNNAFGELPPSGAANFYTRFPGQYYDVETGLHYNINRYYDPSTGRYIQSDPIGLIAGAGMSTYGYVGNGPLNYVDILGLFPEPPERDAKEERTAEGEAALKELRDRQQIDREVAEASATEGPAVQHYRSPSEFGPNGMCARLGTEMSTVGPIPSNGASTDGLLTPEIIRIQNAADRAGVDINLVGSRATNTANANSDWDYVINANARTRNSLSRSLPGAGNLNEGIRPNIDVFSGGVNPGAPSIKFTPRQ